MDCQDYGFFELFFRLFSLIFTRSTPSLSNDFILYDTNELLRSHSFLSFLMFPFHSGISRTKENKKTIDLETNGTRGYDIRIKKVLNLLGPAKS